MGVLDLLSSPNFSSALMALGQGLSAQAEGRAFDPTNVMKHHQNMMQRQKMAQIGDSMLGEGILERMMPGYSPDVYGVLGDAIETAPGAMVPGILENVMRRKPADPWANYKTVPGVGMYELNAAGKPELTTKFPADPKFSGLAKQLIDAGYEYGTPEFEAKMKELMNRPGIGIGAGGRLTAMGGHTLDRKNIRNVVDEMMSDELLINQLDNAVGWMIQPDGSDLTPEGREALTWAGRLGADFATIKEKMGRELSPEEKGLVKRVGSVRGGIGRVFNIYRKEITGAAAAVQELDRLMKTFIHSEMGPTQFLNAYQNLRNETLRAMRLRRKFLRDGVAAGELMKEATPGAMAYDRAFMAGGDDDPELRFNEVVQAIREAEPKLTEEEVEARVYEMMVKEGYIGG